MDKYIEMENYKNVDWNLIAKNLSGEISESEETKLNEWVNASDNNRQTYQKISDSWHLVGHINEADKINVEASLKRVKNKINDTVENVKIISFKRWVNIAAAVFIGLVVGTGLYFYSTNNIFSKYAEVQSGTVQNTVEILPDGSEVYLNANSSIKYLKEYNNTYREITLNGEAYFDVKPDKNRPFIIRTNESVITVLGTAFNVKAYETSNKTVVTVSTGKVKLSNNSDEQIETKSVILEKGACGVVYNDSKEISSSVCINNNNFAWRTKKMRFTDTPLDEVRETLESVYQVSIRFKSDDLKELPLTADIYNDEFDTVVQLIKRTFDIEAYYSGNEVVFARKN